MANGADGTIRIDTRIETGEFQAGTREMEDAVKRVAQASSTLGAKAEQAVMRGATAVIRANMSYSKMESRLDILKQKFSELYREGDTVFSEDKVVASDKFAKLKRDAEEYRAALSRLEQERIRIEDTDVNYDKNRDYQTTLTGISMVKEKLSELDAKMMEMQTMGTAWIPMDEATAYQSMLQRIVDLEEELRIKREELQGKAGAVSDKFEEEATKAEVELERERAAEVQKILEEERQITEEKRKQQGGQGPQPGGFGSLNNVLADTWVGKLGQIRTAITPVTDALGGVYTALKKIRDIGQKIIAWFKKQLQEMRAIIDRLRKTIEQLRQLFSKKTDKFNFKNLLRYGLGIRSLFVLFNKIRNAFKEGMNNLAEYDPQVKESITSLKNALGTLKNSLGTAFAPILKVIAPALNTLINLLVRAANAVARLTAQLTGQTTYVVAKGYDSLAGSVSGAGEAAKEAKRYLTGLDEVAKWPGDSDGSGGGGGGAGDGSQYETLSVDPFRFNSWGEAFSAFLTFMQDKGVPALDGLLHKISGKINEFSSNVVQMFTFPGVQDQVSVLGASIGTSLNDFINNQINWNELGQAVGLGIETGLNFAANLVNQFDFLTMGKNLGGFFNSAIDEIEPRDLADVLSTKIRAGIGIVGGFLMTADLEEFGFKAAEFVNRFFERIAGAWNEIDWWRVRANISEGIRNFVDNTNWDEVFATLRDIRDDIFGTIAGVMADLQNDPEVRQLILDFIDFLAETALEYAELKFAAKMFLFGEVTGSNKGSWFGYGSNETMAGAAAGNDINLYMDLLNILNGTEGALESTAEAAGHLSREERLAGARAKTAGRQIGKAAKGIRNDYSDTLDAIADSTADTTGRMGARFADMDGRIRAEHMRTNTALQASAKGTGEALSTAAATMAQKVGQTYTQMGTDLSGKMSSMRTSAKEAFSGIAQDVETNASNARVKGTTHIETLRGALNKKFANMYSTESQNMGNLFANVRDKTSDANTKGQSNIETLRSTLATKFGQMSSNAGTEAESLRKAIVDKASAASGGIKQLNFKDAGQHIKNGLIDGMGDFNGKLDQWANQFKDRILKNFKINSPSRWSRDDVGWYLGLGMAEGLDDSERQIIRACDDIADAITNVFGDLSPELTTPSVFAGKVVPAAVPSGRVSASAASGRLDEQKVADMVTEAVTKAMANMTLTASCDRSVLFRLMIGEARLEQMRTGANPLTAF